MDVTAIAAVATDLSRARTADAVSTAVLKKALDIQSQGAAQLLEAAVQAMATTASPSHLGNSVNIFV